MLQNFVKRKIYISFIKNNDNFGELNFTLVVHNKTIWKLSIYQKNISLKNHLNLKHILMNILGKNAYVYLVTFKIVTI